MALISAIICFSCASFKARPDGILTRAGEKILSIVDVKVSQVALKSVSRCLKGDVFGIVNKIYGGFSKNFSPILPSLDESGSEICMT